MTRQEAQVILDAHDIERMLDDDEEGRLLQEQNPELFDAYEALRAYAQEKTASLKKPKRA